MMAVYAVYVLCAPSSNRIEQQALASEYWLEVWCWCSRGYVVVFILQSRLGEVPHFNVAHHPLMMIGDR